jgi:hypothetical protein
MAAMCLCAEKHVPSLCVNYCVPLRTAHTFGVLFCFHAVQAKEPCVLSCLATIAGWVQLQNLFSGHQSLNSAAVASKGRRQAWSPWVPSVAHLCPAFLFFCILTCMHCLCEASCVTPCPLQLGASPVVCQGHLLLCTWLQGVS